MKITEQASGLVTGYVADVVSYSDYSPFGAPLSDRTWTSDGYRYGFNTQEKVDEIAGNGNHTDILGDKWKDPDKDGKRAKDLNKKLETRKNEFTDLADKHLKKYNRAVAKGKENKAEKMWSKFDLYETAANEMQKAQNELAEIGAHPTLEFTFSNCAPGSGACYTLMDNDGVINLENSSDATAIHELAHGYQHITGEIQLVAGTGGGYYGDLYDERAAYRRQYIFSPSSFSNIESKPGLYIKDYRSISIEWVRYAKSVTLTKDVQGRVISRTYGEELYKNHPWNRVDRSTEEFFDRHPELSRSSPIIK
jgi:hypothetical protein